jgi:hypothetical protein
MQTTGIFTIHQVDIPIKKLDEPIYLIPFGDIHRSSPMCHTQKWLEFLDWAKKKKNAYFLGMGDYDDLASASERKILVNKDLHDSSLQTLEKLYLSHTKRLYDEIKFMEGRIIGLMEGNHYGEFLNGTTTTQKLAELLKCKYLGVSTFIRLSFSLSSSKAAIDIWAHHGKGAARLIGGSLNRVQQMGEAAEADIYCVDEETEILTKDGWKRYNEIQKDDIVYSYSIENKKIELDIAKDVIINEYSGEMYEIKNSNLDMLLSPNHRVLYRQRGGDYLIKKAKEFENFKSQVQFPVAGLYEGTTILSDEKIALAAWIISEGSFLGSGIRIYQKYEEKTQIIKNLLDKIGYGYTLNKRSDGMNVFYIHSKHKKDILFFVKDKDIPEWVYSLDQRQFDIFLSNLVKGDGCANSETSGQYYSSNVDLIDRLQIACTLHNYRTIKQYKKGGFKNGGWRLLYSKRDTVDYAFSKNDIKKVEYKGIIWCVNTSNTTIICRRNGKVFITGNCMGHDHKKSVGLVTKLSLASGKGGLKLRHRKQLYARTGSFLKGYEDNKVSYVADMALSPTDLGVVKIELTPRRNRKGGEDRFYVDIHASI